MMQGIAISKILQPRAVLLEQVGGFDSHCHKSYLIRLFRWAGFSLHWAKVIDANAWCGSNRKRWLAVLIRIGDDKIIPLPMERWPLVFDLPTPHSLDAVLEPDMTLDDRLQVKGVALDLSSRHDLLPPAKRSKTSCTEVLQSRCVNSKQQVQTFMASYGSQHEFSMDFLRQRGLLAHYLLTDSGHVRFWHPIEILFLHCAVGFHFIPSDWTKAWKFLGNQICVPHALLLLSNVFRMMPTRCTQFSVESAFQKMTKMRLSAGSCFVTAMDAGHFVSDQPIEMHTILLDAVRAFMDQNFTVPAGKCWLLEKGGLCEIEELPRHPDPLSEIPIDATIDTQLSKITEGEPEDLISPTVDFCPVVKGLMHLPPKKIAFWTSANLSPDSFAGLWNLPLCFSEGFSDDIEHSFHLVLQEHQPVVRPLMDILCFHQNHELVLLEHTSGVWRDITKNGEDKAFDAFGEIQSMPTHDYPVVFDADPLMHFVPSACDHLAVFAASSLGQALWTYYPQDLAATLLFEGSDESVKTLCGFWGMVIDNLGLSQFGWNSQPISSHCTLDLCIGFSIKCVGPYCPIPHDTLWTLIVIAAIRTLLATLTDQQGKWTRLKWMARPVWEGMLSPNLPLSVLSKAMQLVCIPSCGRKSLAFRVVNAGRNISIEQTIGDCWSGDKGITLHFIPEIHGGGPATSSKTGFQTQVRNALASTLLQEGFQLKWVTSAIEQAVDKIGIKNLAPIAAKTHGVQRLSAIKDAFQGAGIELPHVKPGVSSAASLKSKSKKQAVPAPDAKNYRALPGYLLFEDGNQATQLTELRNGITGFYLATPDVALPWLRSGDVISSDELALVVLGDPPCTSSLSHCQITLPCKDEHDRDVLIAAHMFQLGQKKIAFREFDKHIIDVANTSLVALTLWKEDWLSDWDFVSKHTFAHIRKTFALEDSILSIWGRSFKKGKASTTPSDAVSCQVHCTVKEASLANFLKASGGNLIWATPKTTEGRPSQQFRLLWLQPEMAFSEAVVLCAKIRGSHGLHRGKDRFAIRISRAEFPAAWKELYPHENPPCDVEAVHMMKLEVLPFGTTAPILLEWAAHLKWPIKPIRALGPRSWLIGSPVLPPDSLHFNGAPILARILQPRTQHAPSPIIAGPKPSHPASVQQPGLPGLSSDPWAAWTGPRPTPPAVPAATRTITGPVESKLNEQNDRIEKLESSIQQLQTNQEKQSKDMQENAEEVRKRDQQLRTHMDSRLGEIRKELDATFTSALQQQSKSFESGMMELKNLLTQGKAKRKTTPDDMEP